MGGFSNGTGRDQAAFMAARIPSFTHFLSSYDPGLLPAPGIGPLAGGSRWVAVSSRRKSWADPKFNSGSDGR